MLYLYSMKEKDTTTDLQLQLAMKLAELAAKSAELSQAKTELSAKTTELFQSKIELSAKTTELSQSKIELSAKTTELSQSKIELSQKEAELNVLKAENLKMEQELLYFKRVMFGKKSERFIPLDPAQLCLNFNAQEQLKEETPDIKPVLEEIQQETVNRRNRVQAQKRKPVRQQLPENIERVERLIEPRIDNLQDMVRIGEDVKEVLHYKPGTLWVERIIRPVYRLKVQPENHTATAIYQAELPEFPIAKSFAGADLLAFLTVSKFADHLPVYRTREILKRHGIDLSASTIGDWFESVAMLLRPLYQAMVAAILQSGYIQIDESTIPVIDNEKHKAAKAYLWVVRSIQKNMVFFHYDQGSRSQRVVISLLRDYKGTIQTDGYDAYSIYENKKDILLLGCWAHARRYFEKALSEDRKSAEIALSFIAKLYEVEANLKESNADDKLIVEKRTRQSLTVIREFEKWMYSIAGKLLPKSLLGKAVNYTFAMLPRLTRYVTDARYRIDNNPVENSIRPMAIGRKNYLFCGNDRAASDTAMYYTFFGCCKLAGVNPLQWLTFVLENINQTKINEIHRLFPENLKSDI